MLHSWHPLQAMSNLDPVVLRELPVIRKIIADETWLEGERRGGYVSSDDPVVQQHVCDIILSIGEKLRELFQDQTQAQLCPVITDCDKAA
jgi:hypothetical protein